MKLPPLLAVLVLALPLGAQTGDNPRLRWEFVMQQKAWPRGEVPEGALQRAQAQYRAQWPGDAVRRRPRAEDYTLRLEAGGAPSPFGSARWTPMGPAPIPAGATSDAGRIAALVVHPTDRRVLYVGGAQGGVWKTTDGGASWLPLTDGECSLAMGALALDPANPEIVYAGTGEMNFSADSYYGCGVLRSTDGGATWSRLGASVWDSPSGGATISKVVVDRATAGTTTTTLLHVASSSGYYRSTDGGATWTQALPGIVSDLVADPTTDGAVLYAAVGSAFANAANGVYRSTDRGQSWTRLTSGFPSAEVGRIALAHGPASGSVVAAVQNAFGGAGPDGTLLGIWRTTDGATWSQLPASGASCGTQCWYDIVVAVHPTDASRLYFGGVSLYRSTDGGASFATIGGATVHVDHHAWAFDPQDASTVYAGSDGGIYKSTDGGTTWASLNTNLELTQFYGGLSAATGALARVLGGTQDNGTVEWRENVAWPRVLGGDGGFTATHPLAPDTAWAETQWVAGQPYVGPRRRTTATGGFAQMLTGIATSDRALFIPPLVMDVARPSRLLFGTYRLYETTNGGNAWTAISGDLSKGSGAISAIGVAASDARTIYVGTSDGSVRVTTDGGASWGTATGLPNRYVEDFAVDPGDARRAWVAFSGFGTGHVWRTTDAGATWSNVSGNLPDVPVNALALVPGTGDLYAGSDLGMFVATAGGATWTPFNDGFPNVAVFDLLYHGGTSTLLAATHGRGVFARAVAGAQGVLATIAPGAPAPLVAGESLALTASARTPDGLPVATTFAWASSNAAVATVDASGRVTARGEGTATITATAAEGAASSVAVTVAAPSTLTFAAVRADDATAPLASVRGATATLLRVTLAAAGVEPVRVDTLAFDLTTRDAGATLRLVVDADRDGVADAGETATAGRIVALPAANGVRRLLALDVGTVNGGQSLALLAQVTLDGGAPHGSTLALALAPAATRATGVRSGRADAARPAVVLAEASRRTTVLASDEPLALSENPVRGERLILTFRERPRTAAVYTLTGRRVADLRSRLEDDVRVAWDLTNDQGSRIAPGVYLVVFDVGGRVARQKLFVTRDGSAREE